MRLGTEAVLTLRVQLLSSVSGKHQAHSSLQNQLYLNTVNILCKGFNIYQQTGGNLSHMSRQAILYLTHLQITY